MDWEEWREIGCVILIGLGDGRKMIIFGKLSDDYTINSSYGVIFVSL